MSDTTAHSQDGHVAHGPGEHHGDHHVVGWKLLTIVFLALMVLTFLTVAAINVDLGPLNIVVALGIALVKAFLVIFIFMHVYWDRAFHGLLIAASFAFVALFIAFTLIDSTQYGEEIVEQDKQDTLEAIDTGNYVAPPALEAGDGGH